ncbi:unnamed protein product, partial [Phaeothamnion confervicola]
LLAEDAVPPEEGAADAERYGTRWVVTQASLNGLGRYMGYYLEVMALLKPAAAAAAAWERLCLLVDEYLYSVFSLFVPVRAGAALWAEYDEPGAPLPCDRDATSALRNFLERVMKARGLGLDAFARMGGRERRTRIAFPRPPAGGGGGGPTASQSPEGRMGLGSGGIVMGDSSEASAAQAAQAAAAAAAAAASAGGAAAVAAASAAAAAAAAAAASGRAWLGGSDSEAAAVAVRSEARGAFGSSGHGDGGSLHSSSSHGGSGGGSNAVGSLRSALRTGPGGISTGSLGATGGGGSPAPGSPSRPIPLPAAVDPEQGSGEANLFGLGERAVAAESCLFVARLLRAVYKRAAERRLLPPRTLAACEVYVRSVVAVAPQLRLLIYRAVAPLLVGADRLALSVGSQRWALQQIQNDVSAYVESVCERCETLRAAVLSSGGAGRGGGGVAALSVPLPPAAQRRAWAEAVQAIMETLVEGFSRAKSCSTEGRALMSMDLQAISGGLERPCGRPLLKPERGRSYALAYINAFYYGQADLVAWVEQNWRRYRPAQMTALLLC